MSINLNVNGNTAPLEAAVQAAVNRIRKTPIKVTVDDKGATQPLGNMKRGADEFSKSMEAANARIIAFGASMAIINGISDAFKAMVTNVVQVEKALADINVVMGLSLANLDKFSDSLFKVAKETAASFDVAAAAATEYARQGLAVEETLKRTKDALILTRLTGMDSANAVKALTAAMNTYGDEIKDTTQLVSKFAAVDVKFAVSAEDFADAISRTGQAAKSAGVDIDELVGLVTAAQQKTARGGKVIGNSFKTIFTRIGRADTLNQLENLGIAVRDVEGNTMGAKRILTDLANTFDSLTESQKAQIAQTVGGVFQINVLKAVLSDAAKQNGILANATQISAGATDEAIQKNEQLRSTMSAMASETGLALKEVSAKIGELAIAPGMEKILNIVKGFAEGASDMLGDGESSGNKFATGFLKGLGNIITGPGLVVIVAVFGKLFLKAAQYARESLSSLIGVTSEAQKQKAIQTSLVTLFGQNAALSKEMLRTDISRTEKERIILGLLKAQVVEANTLNTIARSSAANLYQKGYGSNLAPRGKPRRTSAQGYIPNYVDAERQQAAQGGYAAGSIRSMNMPGEGSVIYNSAEKVKNFKGMSQPAIMPPKSSKAGENYQQAFDSIHGFDPYAAGGYIPNFFSDKEIGKKNAKKAKTVLNAENKIILLTANYPGKDLDSKTYWVRDAADKEAGTGTRVHSGVNTLRGSLTGKSFGKGNFKGKNKNAKPGGTQIDNVGVDMRQVKVPTFSLDKSESRINLPRNKSFQNYAYDKLKKYGKNLTIDMANRLMPGQKIDKFKNNQNAIEDSDVAVMGGRIFEKVLEAITEEIKGLSGGHKGALLDVPANPKLFKVFGAKDGDGSIGAEAKISSDEKHVKSAARKIFDVLSKTEDRGKQLEKAFPAKKAGTTLSKTSQIRKSGGNAYGHIPNFAAARLALTGGLVGKNKFGNIDRRQMTRLVRSNPYFNGLMNEHLTWDSFPKKDKRKLSRWLLKQGVSNRALQAYGLASMHSKSIGEGISSLAMAKGYIPNFADPLSDAIGREKEAGVPVSKIRIGSHPALMGKSNPVGLGVTNTDDEPNGLRDVFGAANGYVPNYAPTPLTYSDIGSGRSGGSSAAQAQMEKNAKQYNKELKIRIDRLRKGNYQYKDFERSVKKLNGRYNVSSNARSKVNKELRKEIGLIQRNNLSRQQMSTQFQKSSLGRGTAKMGKMFGGNFGMMAMMGAPMAAGFLQKEGAGQTGAGGAMYSAGGALQGAATGGMMASMIAPMFGPAAPLVIGVGGLIGAVHGMTSANEENTKALKEKREQELKAQIQSTSQAVSQITQGSELSRTLSSAGITEQSIATLGLKEGDTVLQGLQKSKVGHSASQQLVDVMKQYEAGEIETVSPEKLERHIDLILKDTTGFQHPVMKSREEVMGYLANRPGNDMGKAALYTKEAQEYMGGTGDPDFYGIKAKQQLELASSGQARSELIDYLMENEKKKSFAYDFGEKKGGTGYLDKAQYAALLKGQKVDVGGKIGPQKLSEAAIQEALTKESERIKSEHVNVQTEQRDALILQLNFQRVMLKSQKAAADAQLDIKSKYLKQSNLLDSQEKMLGGLMSEEQKVRIQYNKNLTKASEAYASGAAKAESDFSMGLLQDIQGQGKDSLRSAIKQELFARMSKEETKGKTAGDITNIELSSKLAAMSSKEKEELLTSLKEKNKGIDNEVNEILGNRKLIYNDQIDTLEKQKTLSDGQSLAQKNLNEKIAKQKDLMVGVNREMQDYIRGLDNAAQSRAIASEITAARFGARPQTQGAIFAEQGRLAKERQQGIRESYTKSAISEMQKLATDKGLTKEQRLKIAADPSKLKDMSSVAIDSMEESFKSRGGSSKTTMLEQLIKNSPTDTEAQKKLQISRKQELNELKTLEQSIADAKAQTSKQEDDIITKLKEQKTQVEERISKEKILQEIREKEYARKTGPGAFGEGIKDAGIDMEKRVAMMDYELGTRLPQTFANGLSGAFIEAINGAKDLDDALREAGLNFLKMIQEAMMQKMVMQMMGGLGFSQGGNVRNYSKGGNVPARVSNGEYLMSREAVNKYGGSFMHGLNARGKAPGFSSGGRTIQPGSQLSVNPGSFDSGRKYQRRQMSGFFYSGQGNTMGMREDQETVRGIIAEREAKRREEEAKARAKKQEKRAMWGMLASTVAMGAISHMMSGGIDTRTADAKADGYTADTPSGVRSATKDGYQYSLLPDASAEGFNNVSKTRSWNPFSWGGSGASMNERQFQFNDFQTSPNYGVPLDPFGYNDPRLAYFGGKISNYANGGPISGKPGIDQIPAMLSEGEYVVKASSARQIGKPMLDRINAGKFYNGGAVSEMEEASDSGISGGKTNNINISVNIEKGSVKSENSESKGDDEKEKSEGSSLAEKIKEQILSVIIEEQRPGGVLED